ncbi:cyclin-dependent kinase inhibitor 4-like [Tasmannia lanceolata]|uniref:cyclin-dependent kinase inhibitor 4-like n=1 Tax=Tasmannia lanceolata TaxID=3420 RepID=UPI00406345D1
MGKYMRKANITGEVTVMEVSQSTLGVRTRARTLALQRLQKTSPSYLQLRSRRLEKTLVHKENPSCFNDSKKTKENPCTDPSRLDSGSLNSLSCSEKKREVEKESISPSPEKSPERSQDNEASFGENVLEIDARERNIRETTPSSLIRDSDNLGTPGSTTRPTNSTATNRRIQNVAHRTIPTSNEMEEFFAGVEQQHQRKFTEKYNYDPVNDLPLPGRYEWVRLDP